MEVEGLVGGCGGVSVVCGLLKLGWLLWVGLTIFGVAVMKLLAWGLMSG